MPLDSSSRALLKCDVHIARGLFRECQHWDLATGDTLEARRGITYGGAFSVALILWRRPAPGATVGDSVEAHSLLDAFASLRSLMGEKLAELPLDQSAERERLAATMREFERLSVEVEIADWSEECQVEKNG